MESPVVGPHGGRYGPAWSLQQTDPRWPPGTEAHKHLCRQDYSHSQPRSSLTPRCGRAGPASLETGRHRGDSGSPGPGQSPSASTHSPTSVSPSWRMGLERQETLNTHLNLTLSSGGGCGDWAYQHVLLVVTHWWAEGAAGTSAPPGHRMEAKRDCSSARSHIL